MRKLAMIIALLGMAMMSCKKDSNKTLPPLTFTGGNTFGCYVNGKLFVPDREADFTGGCGGASGVYEVYYGVDTFAYVNFNGAQCEEDRAIQIECLSTKLRRVLC